MNWHTTAAWFQRDEFQFTLYAADANTAAPVFSSPSYTVYVKETFPVGLVVGNLVISASGEQTMVTDGRQMADHYADRR